MTRKIKKILSFFLLILNLILLVFIVVERNKTYLLLHEIKKLNDNFLMLQNINTELKNNFAKLANQDYLLKKAEELGLTYKIEMFHEKIQTIVAK